MRKKLQPEVMFVRMEVHRISRDFVDPCEAPPKEFIQNPELAITAVEELCAKVKAHALIALEEESLNEALNLF